MWDWFVDNKLSIHFGQDKTKSILFGAKDKFPNAKSLNILKYLGCSESMALNVIDKINSRFKFLHRQKHFLNTPFT